MQFLTGEDPISVFAEMGNLRHKKFEDYAQIMLTYKDGKSAFIKSNGLTLNNRKKSVIINDAKDCSRGNGVCWDTGGGASCRR